MVLDSLVSAVIMCCWFYPLVMNSGLNSSHPECDVGYWGLGTFLSLLDWSKIPDFDGHCIFWL